MQGEQTNDAATALQAIGWTLGDDSRAARFLALTGLTPETLREGLGDAALLAATTPPAPHAHARIDDWGEALPWILGKLG